MPKKQSTRLERLREDFGHMSSAYRTMRDDPLKRAIAVDIDDLLDEVLSLRAVQE